MKLIPVKKLTVDEGGVVNLTPDNLDDLWFCYNLIAKGDRLSASTIRKVHRETTSGSKAVERLRTTLQIEVEALDYDNVAHILRIRGKTVAQHEHVKIGVYHTLEIEQNRSFSLEKDAWNAIAIKKLQTACNPAASVEVAALTIEEGLAYLCLVGQTITTTKAEIHASVPRKHARGAAKTNYDKAANGFLENILQAVVRHVDFSVVQCLVVAGPGPTKDQFYSYLLKEAAKRELWVIIENKRKIIMAHASSGDKHALKEVLSAPSAMRLLITNTKAIKEVRALKAFFTMLSKDSSRVVYGSREVEVAHDRLAIEVLLLSDELFRNADVGTRRKYADLTNSVKASGGEVHIFSPTHVSGEKLSQLSGIAAILRFPLPDLEDMDLY